MTKKVVIIMGSKGDLPWCEKISQALSGLGVESEMRVASAHKVPLRCLDIIKENEESTGVFITVAGRSNALSGFADAQTHIPVIACPPYGEKYAGADVYSSINMPSGVAPMLVADAKNAALAAAKIIALAEPDVAVKVRKYQKKLKDSLEADDKELKDGKR
jgi:5-(carboxyamino)imidazole ribonucleotide mutase